MIKQALTDQPPLFLVYSPSEPGVQSWQFVLASMVLVGSVVSSFACWHSIPRISRWWPSTTWQTPSTWRCCSSTTASTGGSTGRSRPPRRPWWSTASRFPSSPRSDPANLPWKSLGCQVALESTGFFTSREKLQKHIDAGAERVILSAPAKDKLDATIVLGVNDQVLNSSMKIVSNASCTTNCLAPMAKVLHETFGIEKGLMTTIHAYTNDQRVADQIHEDMYRSRAAAVNMIPTKTGAAKAVGEVIPELNGKLTGFAVRVPVPDGSMTDLTAVLKKTVTKDEVNGAIKAAAEGPLKGILEYNTDPIVSSDIIGNPHSCIFVPDQTLVIEGNLVKVIGWYDNEWGYSVRTAELIAKLGAL